MDTPEAVSTAETAVPALRQTSFGRDVLKLVSGTTLAQIITILAAPLLTRLYAPEAFGLLALFISMTSILGVVACLRYELSIMLPESDETAANLLGVSMAFTVLISSLTVAIIWWGGSPLLRLLNAPGLGPYLWLIPPAVFTGGIFLALNYWNSRTRHFGRLSVARVSQSVTSTAAQLGLGLAGLVTGGALIGATVGGQALATAVLGGQIWRDDRKLFRRSIHWREMVLGVKRYRKFPLYDTWSALLNTISWQLPALMLSTFFSSGVVGYYALGYRVIQLPMSLIGGAIGQVFFQRASEAYLRGELSDVVENTFRQLVMIGLFPMLILTFIGRDLFAVIFGPAWVEAGVYVQILSIWAFFWFVSSPLSTVFSILEKQEFLLKFNLVNFVTRFASLWLGGVYGEPRAAVFLFSITGIFVYSYLLLFVLAYAGISLRKATGILGKSLLLFLPAGGILLYLVASDTKIELRLLIAGFLLMPYFLLLVKTQPAFTVSNFARKPGEF